MKPGTRDAFVTSVLLALLVCGIAACTNALDIARFSWDFRYYIAMAREGITAVERVAPFAHRWLWTEIVRALHVHAGLSLDLAFRVVAWAGVYSALLLLHAFLRRFGFAAAPARWAVVLTALQLGNAKFLLFDVYRPETLAFPAYVLALGALVSGRTVLCAALCVVGLQVREFLGIPALLAVLVEMWPRLGAFPARRPRPLVALALLVAMVVAIALPRVLLPVTASFQALDVVHNPRAWRGLFGIPKLFARDLNFAFCLLSYLLPTLLLLTRDRVSEVRRVAGDRGPLLVLASLLTLVLMMYGGTDLFRFVAYLFVPQAVVLAVLAGRARGRELAYAVLAVALFNRIPWPVPNDDLGRMLDFYGGWDQRVNGATLARTLEACGWILGAWAVRALPGTRRAGP